MTELPRHLVVRENWNSLWNAMVVDNPPGTWNGPTSWTTTSAQLVLIWERARPRFSLCVLLAAVSEDLDPVVFPVLFLVKRSWLCSGFRLPTSPRLLPPLCPCLEHWKVSWGTCSVRAVWEVRKENVAAFRTRLDISTCPIILMRCFKNCLFFHLG